MPKTRRSETPTTTPSSFYTAREVCDILKVSRVTIWAWRRKKGLPRPIRMGSVIRFVRAEVEAWVAEQPRG